MVHSLLVLATALITTDTGDPSRFKSGPLRIGVINAGASQVCIDRLQSSVAGCHVEPVEADAGVELLRQYDVIVLPSEWLNQLTAISKHRADYRRYVAGGGGLLIFQPNPNTSPGKSLEINLMSAKFTVHSAYTDKRPLHTTPHPITKGLDEKELPYPHDRITAHDERWEVLAKGDVSGCAALMVARFGGGRAAVNTANPGRKTTNFHSDRFLDRLLLWLGSRRLPPIE